MTVERILERLAVVRQTGERRWIARCPAHEDRSPSLAIRETEDERILLHDFAGCSIESILAALGLSFRDLYPAPLGHHFKRERRPFDANQVLAALVDELVVAELVAADVERSGRLEPEQSARLHVAAVRFSHALAVLQ